MSSVSDIIDGVKHRIQDRANIYPSLNNAVRLIAKRLFHHHSSMVAGALSVTISADSNTGTLPADFWGLMTQPYISGKNYNLRPLPDEDTRLRYQSNSVPIWYEVAGLTMNLFPGCSEESTLAGKYFQRPTRLTKPSDTIPFNEEFDDAIQESLLHVLSTGKSTGNPNDIALLRALVNEAVDSIAPYLEKTAPIRIKDSNGLGGLING